MHGHRFYVDERVIVPRSFIGELLDDGLQPYVEDPELVGSVLRLSVKYGGRADVMLDRMAVFMRDLEQAERELVAMSAETRLSAWVLGALPVGIGSFVIATNPKYFSAMWLDPTGRQLVYLAFILQIAGGYWLYRLARLR